MRRSSERAGLVIVCQGAEPGLGLLNAERFREPYGCPAIHVATMPGVEPKRMVSDYQRTNAEACNVVVTVPGRDRSLSPVVVMTPRSSWWQSTSERGGGLVCWLETLRALIAEPPLADVVMTANSGHELGHLGLDAFLERRPGWDQPNGDCRSGFITGPNIGAAGGQVAVDPVGRCTVARGDARFIDRVRPAARHDGAGNACAQWRNQGHSSRGRALRHVGRDQQAVSFAPGSLAPRGRRSGDRTRGRRSQPP